MIISTNKLSIYHFFFDVYFSVNKNNFLKQLHNKSLGQLPSLHGKFSVMYILG